MSLKVNQNTTRHYLLINFYCGGYKKSEKVFTSKQVKKSELQCPFYVQYVEDPVHRH